jgi:hypothetical protein
MFKVLSTVSNVRPSKSEEPELSTTPTGGNIRVNAPGAIKIGVAAGEYAAIVKGEDENGVGLFIVKGNAPSEKGVQPAVRQVGSVLSGNSGLLFSSENAYRELDGNKDENKIYSIGDEAEFEYEGQVRKFYRLNFKSAEPKSVRVKKGE